MAFLPSPAGYYSRSELLTFTETRHYKKAKLAFYKGKTKWNAIIFTARRCSAKKKQHHFLPVTSKHTQKADESAYGARLRLLRHADHGAEMMRWKTTVRTRFYTRCQNLYVRRRKRRGNRARGFPCGSIPVPRQPASPPPSPRSAGTAPAGGLPGAGGPLSAARDAE